MGKQLRNSRHQALMEALVAARNKSGITQRELARRLRRSHSFIGKIERGERQLNVLEFCELADALGVSPKDLFARIVK
jgi:transcriptional regulator with XRE-family HTH domain